jgi:hypothetical protein
MLPNEEAVSCPGLLIYMRSVHLDQPDAVFLERDEKQTLFIEIAGWPLIDEIVREAPVLALCNQHLHLDAASQGRKRIYVLNRPDERVERKLEGEIVETARALGNGRRRLGRPEIVCFRWRSPFA